MRANRSLVPSVLGIVVWCVVASVGGAFSADGVVRRHNVDPDNSAVFHDEKKVELDETRMLHALGLKAMPDTPPHRRRWSARRVEGADREDEQFHYLIALKNPIEVASVLCNSSTVGLLKPGAPFPGTPTNADHWVTVNVAEGKGPRMAVFDEPVRTRAVLFTDASPGRRSTLGPVRLYAERFYNMAPLAGARARSEYHAPRTFGSTSYPAINAARGTGSWVSSGKNRSGNITAPPVSDVHQQWYVLGWDDERTLSGFYIQDNFGELGIDVFVGPDDVQPVVGVDKEWKRLLESDYTMKGWQGRWIEFAEPIQTRGVRFRISKVRTYRDSSPAVARIDALLALEDAGASPVPDLVLEAPEPPFKVEYASPQDGQMTMVINNEDGRRIRNVFAREVREAGDHVYRWDLKDEQGELIEPGTYRWKGIAAPPLELRYELTTYPNISQHHPENSPWLNGHHGPGGWLADHSSPHTVTTAGDHIFFGAPVAEAGVGFIACDLSGRKLWGMRQFTPWCSGTSLAMNEETVFVEHEGKGHYGATDAGADRVWAVDVESGDHSTFMQKQQTEKRRRGIADMAVKDDELVLAINAEEDWTTNATSWASVDFENCRPRYSPPRDPKRPYEVVPDPRDDFLRLFRLKGQPPGRKGDERLTWLESTKGAGKAQHLLLAFKEPVSIGSCLYPVPQDQDYRVRVSALKRDASYPPNPGDPQQWAEFDHHGESPWDVAVAPPGTKTRALLITFYKGEDDDLARAMASGTAGDPDKPSLQDELEMIDEVDENPALGGSDEVWKGRIKGMRILRHRFRNLMEDASVSVSSGRVDDSGVWRAQRSKPLSSRDSAIYMMQWETPQLIRGLAVKEIDGRRTEIDAFVGPPGADVELEGDEHWENIASYTSPRRHGYSGTKNYNVAAHYLDGTIDFGREVRTRALRLRVVSQWTSHSDVRGGSVAKGGLGIDPTRCRIFGIAPLQYAGKESEVDPLYAQRLEVVDIRSGEIRDEIDVAEPTHLAFAPDGDLYAVASGEIIRIDLNTGKRSSMAFNADLEQPGPLTFDAQGNMYVYEGAPEKRVINVYSPSGERVRQIGEAGGYETGPWNVHRFNSVSDIAVDREDKLWVVDNTRYPKRVSCWTTEGEFLREYLGPARYGGGGVLDPADKTHLFYGPLEFEIDWDTGESNLKNLTWRGPAKAGEVPIYINNRTYMVTRPQGTKQQSYAVVYEYQKGQLRMVAAMGQADEFPPLRKDEIIAEIGSRSLEKMHFLWTDKSGDGQVQFEEVDFDVPPIRNLSRFDDELNIMAGTTAFEVSEFLGNGAPVYDIREYATPPGGDGRAVYQLDDGNFYRIGNGQPDAGFTPEGELLWSYENEGAGVGPYRSASPYTPDQVVCQFYAVGHETADEGALGEFVVVNANFGSWNIWTADGLLAGRIFRDLRAGNSIRWSMPEHERGMRLDEVALTQEHFNGWFVQSDEDKRYYAVAGKNHASVVEVVGLNDFQRSSGTFTVTQQDRREMRDWQAEMVKFRQLKDARVIDCYEIEALARNDAWEELPETHLQANREDLSATFQIGYDSENLYTRYVVKGAGPFKNTGEQWDKLFISGAFVDLKIGTDPDADPGRQAPVRGDKRIVISMYRGKPVAVLYDAINPDAPEDESWAAASAVGQTTFDSVRLLKRANVKYRGGSKSYTVEMVLPLSAIGFQPDPNTRTRIDWGIHEGDKQGTSVINRTYWSNKTAPILADTPSEARLEPHLWGWALFKGRDTTRPSASDPLGDEDEDDVDIDMLLRGE